MLVTMHFNTGEVLIWKSVRDNVFQHEKSIKGVHLRTMYFNMGEVFGDKAF